MNNKICIQNVYVDRITYDEFIVIFRQYLSGKQKKCIGFVNAHCVNVARRDGEYKEIVNNLDLVLPDGIGIMMARLTHKDTAFENLNGTDLIPRLFMDVSLIGATFFLVGGKPGVAARAQTSLDKKWPGVKIVGCEHGYFYGDGEELIAAINKVTPDIVLVGLGVPKQEKWISQNKDRIKAKIFMGVGGFMDFEAGVNARAPQWLRGMGFEWLYRLVQEPGRLWKRYCLGNPEFLYYMTVEAITGLYKNEGKPLSKR